MEYEKKTKKIGKNVYTLNKIKISSQRHHLCWQHLEFQAIASASTPAVATTTKTAAPSRYFEIGMREACQSNQPGEHIITSTSRLSSPRVSHNLLVFIVVCAFVCVCMFVKHFFPIHSLTFALNLRWLFFLCLPVVFVRFFSSSFSFCVSIA